MSEIDLTPFRAAIKAIDSHNHPPPGYDGHCRDLRTWLGENAHLLVAEIDRLNAEAKLTEGETAS